MTQLSARYLTAEFNLTQQEVGRLIVEKMRFLDGRNRDGREPGPSRPPSVWVGPWTKGGMRGSIEDDIRSA